MLYQGKTISVDVDHKNIARMVFNSSDSVNKFNTATTEELRDSVKLLSGQSGIIGLTIVSAKESFIVGADITEFSALFNLEQAKIEQAVIDYNSIFTGLQDLPFPTVTVLDGIALGGGFELALATDFRIASSKAKVGLPEVKLGINPGFGGTIRLPRLIGIDNAVEWIATGKEYKPEQALAVGAIDALVVADDLIGAADQLIADCKAGDIDFAVRKREKSLPVKHSDMERLMAFTTAKGLVATQAGPHMPAPVTSVKSIEQNAALNIDDAVKIEAKFFARLAKTEVSRNLVALFLNEQALSKRTNEFTENVDAASKIAVVGAGIMGGGIAYQSALKGVPAIMKDVAQQGLDLGMNEATKLLAKRVDRGRMTATKMAETLNRIDPTLNYASFGGDSGIDIVVEAVVENLKVKQVVLADVETQINDSAILASNTSTLSITDMAASLTRPEQFCGMHFFNPVHRMPLVEVIRGKKTSDATTAKVVKLAKQMGKTPIVVNDCPGFYVNRVLFPYFAGFNHLIVDGADYLQVDTVMEKFGWPMGPAYLVDVVGIDTACHAAAVMAEGFPSRMSYTEQTPIERVFADNRLGQKNETGFYRYEMDKKGRPKKVIDESTYTLIKPAVKSQMTFTDDEIIERMMIPMLFEVVRCIEENIVSNPVDADMGLLMGIGFPLFRGGPIRYLESIGIVGVIELSKKYTHLGELYEAPALLKSMAADGVSFYGSDKESK